MQAWFGPPSLKGAGIHLGREAVMPISTSSLGVVHGRVGVVHEGIGIVGIIRVEADADAERDKEFMTLDTIWPTEDGEQFFRDSRGILGSPDLGEQDHEFVATLAADGVDVAHAVLNTTRNCLEQAVPHGMAERIIDGLEVVEVEIEQGDQVSVSSGQANGSGEPLRQQGAIGQAGERIMLCLVGHPLQHDLRLGGVVEHDHGADDSTFPVMDGRR